MAVSAPSGKAAALTSPFSEAPVSAGTELSPKTTQDSAREPEAYWGEGFFFPLCIFCYLLMWGILVINLFLALVDHLPAW
jgi:hypothetical protein